MRWKQEGQRGAAATTTSRENPRHKPGAIGNHPGATKVEMKAWTTADLQEMQTMDEKGFERLSPSEAQQVRDRFLSAAACSAPAPQKSGPGHIPSKGDAMIKSNALEQETVIDAPQRCRWEGCSEELEGPDQVRGISCLHVLFIHVMNFFCIAPPASQQCSRWNERQQEPLLGLQGTLPSFQPFLYSRWLSGSGAIGTGGRSRRGAIPCLIWTATSKARRASAHSAAPHLSASPYALFSSFYFRMLTMRPSLTDLCNRFFHIYRI